MPFSLRIVEGKLFLNVLVVLGILGSFAYLKFYININNMQILEVMIVNLSL